MFNWNEEEPDPEELKLTTTAFSNYGKRVNCPGVVELYLDKKHVRFVEFMDRIAELLTNIIKNHVQDGSAIVTDKWSEYNRQEGNGYIHLTANHSENTSTQKQDIIDKEPRGHGWIQKPTQNALVAISIFYSIIWTNYHVE